MFYVKQIISVMERIQVLNLMIDVRDRNTVSMGLPNSTIEVHAYEQKRIDPIENVRPYLHPKNEITDNIKLNIIK